MIFSENRLALLRIMLSYAMWPESRCRIKARPARAPWLTHSFAHDRAHH
jgi:hypothetical protein